MAQQVPIARVCALGLVVAVAGFAVPPSSSRLGGAAVPGGAPGARRFGRPSRRRGLVEEAAATGSFSMFRGGPFRDGFTAASGPKRNGSNWKFLLRKTAFASPTVHPDGSVVYVGGSSGLYGVSPEGVFVFMFPVEKGVVNSAPAVCEAHGVVVFGGQDGVIYGIDARTGALAWSVLTGPAPKKRAPYIFSSPVIDDAGVAYVGASDGGLYAVAVDPSVPAAARVLWTFDARGEPIWSSPALSAAQDVVYVGGVDNFVHAVSAANGTLLWEFEAGGFADDKDDPDVDSSPAVSRKDGTVYVGSFDNRLHALDGASGTVKWSYATSDDVISSPAVSEDGETVYVTSLDGFVHAVAAATGRALWKTNLGSKIFSEPVLDGDGTLFVGADDGALHALDAAAGRRLWDHAVGDKLRGEPAIFGGRAYVATLSDDPFLHCIGLPRQPAPAPVSPPSKRDDDGGNKGARDDDDEDAAPGAPAAPEDAWRTLAIASLAGLALLVVSLLLALVVPRLLKARDRRVRSALLAQHLVDDDAYSDVSFVELRSREGNGPLTSI